MFFEETLIFQRNNFFIAYFSCTVYYSLQVLEKGHGSRPNMGDEIVIQLSQEIPELNKTFPEEQLQYVLGDGDVVQGN